MKRRILSIFLALCMVVCLAPTHVFAAPQATDVATEEELFAAVRNGGGNVRLTDNITVDRGSLFINYTTELDLNGHTLTFREPGIVPITRYNYSGKVISQITVGIAVNANLTLTDSDESKKGKIDVWGDDSTGIYVGPTGDMSMWGGTLTNSSVTIPDESEETPKYTTSIGIFILRGRVSMTSGSRIENETQSGVLVHGGNFSMAGGTTVISGCGIQEYDRYLGGGVYISSERDENGNTVLGSFTMNMGARIENCSAYEGGGVYLDNESVFTINAGYITGCKASHGGGVYVSSVGKVTVENGQIKRLSPAFTMKGGSIESCTANNGGGIYISDGYVGSYLIEFEMNAGSIQNCSAINGGGISVDQYGTFTMSGSAAITGCKATGLPEDPVPEGYGGGVYMFPGGSINLSGGSITGCEANKGESIYSDTIPVNVSQISKYTITGGTADPTVSLAYVSGSNVIRMEGLGTADYPYQIGTKEQLILFRDIVNGKNGQTQNLGACAVLTNDIVLNDGTFDDNGNYTSGLIGTAPEEWIPIGDCVNAYRGTFNGAGHTIKGLYYTGNHVDEYEYTAGLFARLDGATVMNVTVTGYIRRDTNKYYGYKGVAGGIAGEVSNSTIRNCRSACRITTDPDCGLVGGIAGIIDGTTAIENCRNDGHITQHFGENCAAGGMVGSMSGGTVKGCINTGKVDCLRSADIYNQVGCGGVVGSVYAGRISDCINIGEVNVVGNGNAGGIVGYTDGDNITVRSCYSIGNVTAENNLKAGGICGTIRSGTPTFKNCYYLDTSSFDAIGYRADEDGSVEKKRIAEFADGTVLTALIDGRANNEHPWDTEGCKPLSDDENDTTELPVLAWMKRTERHHGGTAYCNSAKLCDGCGKAYGGLDPANHAPDGKQEWTKTATTHEKKWSCCGVVTVASEAHEWANGVCSECGYVCLHDDTDKNHICDYCGKVISNHEDVDKNHVCDLCGKVISNHADADKNHVCDYCGKVISNHEDVDKNHVCDLCGKVISNHADADKNHICDYCGKVISNHADADKNHICDYCGKVISNHTGGKATCKDKAVCEVCGNAYGDPDANNHANLTRFPAKTATKDAEGNIEYWYCDGCGKYYSDAAATTEIARADIITEKLPGDSKLPQTGHRSHSMLWIALLWISGGVLTGVTVLCKKKKFFVK